MKLQNFLEVFRLFSFKKKAKWLLNLLNVYWDHSQSVHPGSVTWCVGEKGELFVYTRGEYSGQILNSVKRITSGITGENSIVWYKIDEIPCPQNQVLLIATEFDCAGDWRIKTGEYRPHHPFSFHGWLISGASWIPTHWAYLPTAPDGNRAYTRSI